jgi:FkbM family methyltransferase
MPPESSAEEQAARFTLSRPSRKHFDLMTKNIAYNDASASVEARNIAVTADDCVLTLYLNRDSAKNSLVRTGNGETVSVPGKKLANLLPEGVKIDILKIDVEGADMDVLRGAEEIFSSAPPDVVLSKCLT